ncbi:MULTISPECIES: multidrug resistance efflux transporter family protein [Mesobacillus]|uniref:DMT family transporter n=1 Tax=Mesobacillus TaxID=2675231 RepID=UPI00177F4BE0|nr:MULTISPECIES: multidrug resistance efflux transporter family protein [Mesobacillus]MCM3575115.1 multidrug resistance efflux transporter family protein [Mesobacillus subterraneus]UYZ20152.1 multidrug resistance efflux transporter family protein [Mesobacillus jeotgali]
MGPILLGILAAFFFAFTFVLNQSMELSGGSWIWSASLRYIFMVPFLLAIVAARRNLKPLLINIKQNPLPWFLWSFVGFVLFYAPLTYAAAFSPGWLIAGTWQVTIISGALLSPLFYERTLTNQGLVSVRAKIPFKGLGMSVIILAGILLMQFEHAKHIPIEMVMLGVIPVLIASFAYPLGNRKMMEVTSGKLDAYQRVLGMTLASLPFWILLAIYGFLTEGVPTGNQSFQSLLVAMTSGVIATVLFFKATDLVSGNMQKLAAVEATQSMEVLFALAGEFFILSLPLPSLLSWVGIILVMLGMALHSYSTFRSKKEELKISA